MAVKTLVAARVATTSGNTHENIRNYPEAAGQSFKRGQFVYLASGKVTACADDAAAILGMALKDASTVTDTDVPVALADANTLYEMCVYHGTPASAITAITQVGVNYALQVDDNKCYVDIEDTGNDAFVVEGFSPVDAIGDQYGRVFVRVLAAASQVQAGS